VDRFASYPDPRCLKGRTGGGSGKQVHLKGRRSLRRRLAILFVAALLSVFGAVACGAGVEEQVEQQVQEGQEQVEQQVEQQVQEATERVEQQADEVRQGIEQEAQDVQKQIEGNAGEGK
jgi:sensor domain CHASE-containing protein